MMTAREVVMRAYAAIKGGDVVGLVNSCAPDVEWRLCGPTACARSGHEGVAEWLMESEPHLGNVRFTPRVVREAGDDIVVVGEAEQRDGSDGPWRCWGRVHIWTLRGGLILRGVEYDATV